MEIDSTLKNMNNNDLKPLLPKSSLHYLNNAESDYDLYIKVTSLRVCLENIMHTVLIHIVKDESNIQNWENWKKNENLEKKIKRLKQFFPEEIYNNIDELRKYSNYGAHENGFDNLTQEKTNYYINKLKKICEWTIISYIRRNGFNTNSWIPTILSTLPPQYRINILEDYFDFLKKDPIKINAHLNQVHKYHDLKQKVMIEALRNGDMKKANELSLTKSHELKTLNTKDISKDVETILLIIDKLAMAYLKNKEYDKSISFIDNCIKESIINLRFYDEMKHKLYELNKELPNLPISRNLSDSGNALSKVSKEIKEEDKNLFLTIFTAILLEG